MAWARPTAKEGMISVPRFAIARSTSGLESLQRITAIVQIDRRKWTP